MLLLAINIKAKSTKKKISKFFGLSFAKKKYMKNSKTKNTTACNCDQKIIAHTGIG
jgi:hypothetical protein